MAAHFRRRVNVFAPSCPSNTTRHRRCATVRKPRHSVHYISYNQFSCWQIIQTVDATQEMANLNQLQSVRDQEEA